MRIKNNFKVAFCTAGFFFLFFAIANSQTYSFINYGSEKNIPNGFIYSLIQADDGFLWVGTANGLSRFDGYTFITVQYPDSSTGRIPFRSLKDKNGVLWFGCSDGTVYYVKDNKLVNVPILNTRSISDMIEGPDGHIFIIPQGKAIFSVNTQKPVEVHQYQIGADQVLLSGLFMKSGDLLLGTQENLLLCRISGDSLSVIKTFENDDASGVQAIHNTADESKFLLGTLDNGLFELNLTPSAEELKRLTDSPEFNSLKVQTITQDAEHEYWVATMGSGAVRFDLSENLESIKSMKFYDTKSGLLGNDVKAVYQDIEGNYWFGLYGEGLSMLASYAMGYYLPGTSSLENNIIFISKSENNYILGTPSGYHIFDVSSGKSLSFTDLTRYTGHTEIKSYFSDQEKNLWFGTGGNGLFMKSHNGTVKQFYKSGDTGSDDVKDIQMDSRNIWLATTNGVLVIDKAGHLLKKFDINNGLPHNSINKILLTSDGSAYIGTESDRLFKIDSRFNITQENAVMTGSTRNKVLAFTKSRNGAIWAATEGNGVFEFMNDSVSSVSRANDLMSNYCYSILADSDNYVWIGHSKGFSRFNPVTGIVRVFGNEYSKAGICNPSGLYESPDKKVFVGTTEGLIVYDKGRDLKRAVAPFSNINTIEINDIPYPYQKSIVLPYKKYKVKIYFSGIQFSSPEKVFYSSYLENFDLDWSKMSTSKEVLYSLGDGKYKFNLISINQDGLSQENPVSFTLLIKKPFYRTWWFLILAAITAIGVVLLIIREREKAQKKIQEYLEKELDARTSVVMKQKGEIELQNIEITDSINYAKRIQSSILPDINKLRDTFRDAFILFHPRDIVSGDFYWFDRMGEDKFIIVCADSTGHGVPGAFMSMIGSTLLQDIVTRKGISKPSEILNLLDRQIFSTLNQNVELGVSNDGMDMVVCEFNISTRHLRFASAMRPVILVLDGESFYIKGNRSSVGGESVIDKFFDDQEYYLKEGDTIYLFSDGLPDQFGGPDGKKMKIARLKRMIEQISGLPMDEQKKAMGKFYFDWKGSFDQVDDVLLMGVKV